jgi:ubiquitin-like protein Pup
MRVIRHADEALLQVWGAADQTQKKRSDGGDAGSSGAADAGGQKKIAKRGEELKEEMDSLIDEIDEVLEENAEEFVKNYVQRGGE